MKKLIRDSVRKNTPVLSLKDGTTILVYQRSFKVISGGGVVSTLPISLLKGYLEIQRHLVLS